MKITITLTAQQLGEAWRRRGLDGKAPDGDTTTGAPHPDRAMWLICAEMIAIKVLEASKKGEKS